MTSTTTATTTNSTTSSSMEDLPLEMIAAIADHVHDLRQLVAMMLVSRRLRGGVSLSKRMAFVYAVLADVGDVEEQRKILMSRAQNLIFASRRCGHARHLRHLQLTQEEALLCLPMACLDGQLECVCYLVAAFDMKGRPKHIDRTSDDFVSIFCDGPYKEIHQILRLTTFLRFHGRKCSTTSIMASFEFACLSADGLPVVKYFREQFGVTLEDVRQDSLLCIAMACRRGNFDTIRYLHEEFSLTIDDIHRNMHRMERPFTFACGHGDLATVQWFHDTFHLTPDDVRCSSNAAFGAAAKGGHLPVVQYLHTTFGLTPADARDYRNRALTAACGSGHIAVLRYLHTDLELNTEDARGRTNLALSYACSGGYLPVVQYLHTAFGLTADDARCGLEFPNESLLDACQNGSLPVVQYLHTGYGLTADDFRGMPISVLDRIFASDNHDVIAYLGTTFGLTTRSTRARRHMTHPPIFDFDYEEYIYR